MVASAHGGELAGSTGAAGLAAHWPAPNEWIARSVGDGATYADIPAQPLVISPRLVAAVLSCCIAVLVGMSVLVELLSRNGILGNQSVIDGFNLDQENNFPSYYSSITLLAAAGLFGLIAACHHRAGLRHVRHWTGLALVFLAMSVDELVSIHETLMSPLRNWLGVDGWLNYAWVIPGAIFVVLFGIAYLRFMLEIPRSLALKLIVAGGVYVGAALGLEMVGSKIMSSYGVDNWRYLFETTVEETLEMIGVLVLIVTLLDYLQTSGLFRWRLTVSPRD